MRFLLSVIAVCLVMITAKLYIPVVNAEQVECGTFDDETLMYVICEPPTLEELDKRIIFLETNIEKINELEKDIKVLKNINHSGTNLTSKQILKLVDANCKTNPTGFSGTHRHSITCKT